MGSAKCVVPLPPNLFPRSEKSAWFWLIGRSLGKTAGAYGLSGGKVNAAEDDEPTITAENMNTVKRMWRIATSVSLCLLWLFSDNSANHRGREAQREYFD